MSAYIKIVHCKICDKVKGIVMLLRTNYCYKRIQNVLIPMGHKISVGFMKNFCFNIRLQRNLVNSGDCATRFKKIASLIWK